MAKYLALGEMMQEEIRYLILETLESYAAQQIIRRAIPQTNMEVKDTSDLQDVVTKAVREALVLPFSRPMVTNVSEQDENAVTELIEPNPVESARGKYQHIELEPVIPQKPVPMLSKPEPQPEPQPEPEPQQHKEHKNPPFTLGEQAEGLAQLKQELEKKEEPCELEFECEPIHNCDIKIRRAFNSGKPKYIEVVFRNPQVNSRLVDKIEKLGLKYNRKKYLCEGFYSEDIWKKLKDMIGVDDTEKNELARMEAEITAMMEAEEAIKRAAGEKHVEEALDTLKQLTLKDTKPRIESNVIVPEVKEKRERKSSEQMDAEAEIVVLFLRDEREGRFTTMGEIVAGTKDLITWKANPSAQLANYIARQPRIRKQNRYYSYR